MTKKQSQHYVWRHYLEQWATSNQLWLSENGKIYQHGLRGVGRKSYFYKLKQLSEADIEFIKNFITHSNNPQLRKVNEGWIDMFTKVFQIKELLKEKRISNAEFENALDILETNIEENFHSKIEKNSVGYLAAILRGDTSFFKSNKDCIAFLHFLALQYMRTNNMQKRQCTQFRKVGGENMETMWPVMRHVFSMNIATSMYLERTKYRLVLLRNNSEVQFITGDQPVINTYAVSGKGTEELEFYYPVSPNIAVLVTEKNEYKTVESIEVIDSQAKWFNQAIADLSDEQIYAFSKESLIEFKKQSSAGY